MSKKITLREVFRDELRDLYSAETQLVKALPKMEKKAASVKLKEAFRSHLQETQTQVSRLEQIATIIDEKLTGTTCKAMKGLISEGADALAETGDNAAAIDAKIIGCAQRIEHYEIAGYGTARAMAEALGEDQVVTLLQETLDEEGEADKKLTSISESDVLPEACAAGDEDEEMRPSRSRSRDSASERSTHRM